MSIGDKIAWTYRSIFILMLLWLRFIEAHIPFWGVWLVWGLIVWLLFTEPFKKRRRNSDAEETSATVSGSGGPQ